MTSSVEAWINRCFAQFSVLLAPAHDAGIYNYILETVSNPQPNNPTLLRLANFSNPSFASTLLEGMLVLPVQPLNVYQALTQSADKVNIDLTKVQSQPRHVLLLLIMSIVILLCTFIIALITCVSACCCWSKRCGCRREKTSHAVFQPTVNYVKQLTKQDPVLSVGSVRATLHDVKKTVRSGPTGVTPSPQAVGRAPSPTNSVNSSDMYVNYPTVRVNRFRNGAQMPYNTVQARQQPQPIQWQGQPSPEPDSTSFVMNHSTENLIPTPSGPHLHNSKSKRAYLTLVCFNYAFILLICFFLTFSLYAMNSVWEYSDPQTSKSNPVYTIPTAVNRFRKLLMKFLEDTVMDGRRQSNITITRIKARALTDINVSTIQMVDELQQTYQITPIFQAADTVSPQLVSVTGATGTIRKTVADTLQAINRFGGEFNFYRDLLVRSMTRLCTSLSSAQEVSLCNARLQTATTLVFSFNTKAVEVDPSVALSTVMEQFNLNSTAVISLFDEARQKIDELRSEIVSEINSRFDLARYLSQLINLWDSFNQYTVAPLGQLMQRAWIDTKIYTDLIAYFITVGGFVALTVYLLVVLIILVCLGLSLNDTFARRFLSIQELLLINGTEHLRVSAIVKSKPIFGDRIPLEKFTRAKVHLQGLCINLGIFGIICSLTVLICLSLIPPLALTNSELCYNLQGETGVALTNRVAQLVFEYEWPIFLKSGKLPSLVASMLVVSAPTNVLSVVVTDCNPALPGSLSTGFLGKLGYKDILNFTVVLEGDDVKGTITNAEQELVDRIKKIDFNSLLPANLDQFAGLLQNVTRYLDGVDYKPSFMELSKNFIPVSNLSVYLFDLRQYVSALPTSIETQSVLSILSLMDNSNAVYSGVIKVARELANQFNVLMNNQNLSVNLKNLLDKVAEARKILTNPTTLERPIRPTFRKVINKFMVVVENMLVEEFNHLVSVVVPCGSLYELFQLMLSVVCVEQSFINRLGSNCLLQAVSTFLIIVEIFLFVRYASLYDNMCESLEDQRADLLHCVQVTYEEWIQKQRMRQYTR
ncbi:hypothetical protein CRM22_002830 [Opisthorchis felineus]|uniref:Prominin n=1 Tax=Opisthorchis felineus TaxID=147828 RepID=A0A4S2MA84_OPIFE|nr:hypothetical protein CRM22_002830 [Opisthorchis felineus]